MEEKKNAELSRSKQKRIEREKKENSKKRNDVLINVVIAIVIIAVIGGLAAIITTSIIKSSNEIVASSNFSEGLEDNGFIKGVKASDYVSLVDYKNIIVPLSEVEYTDAQVDADIQSALESHKVLNSEEGTIADGDTVNIDYVGTIDGVEFDGGNSNGAGSDLTIGSGTFIDDFEQQLIGYKVGEITNVEVTFPDDYSTAELAGQDAVFEVTINGIYELPELTDEFIAEKYAAYASTIEGYRQYLKDTNYEDNLNAYIQNYIIDNSTVNKYPKGYLKTVKQSTRYMDEQSYQYMNQMYMQYYGQGYSSFEEYIGMSDEEYIADLTSRSEAECKSDLVAQAICEAEGISMSAEDVKAELIDIYGSEEQYESIISESGLGYQAKVMLQEKVFDTVKGYVKVQ